MYNKTMNKIFDVVIIGGGPAGMMAGISAKKNWNHVCIVEKNSSLGKKMLLTGKGRCNLTTAKETAEIIDAFGKNGKFLYGALSRFSNKNLMSFFEKRGVKLKTERGQRVFPESNKATDILNCLENELKKKKVKIYFNSRVAKVVKEKNLFTVITNAKVILGKKVIIATGGKSYPITGSSGDGYRLAKSLGHKIIKPSPALVGLLVFDNDIKKLAGLSLKNVNLSFLTDDKVFAEGFGEMLFTHRGISGPIILRLSEKVDKKLSNKKKVRAEIDLKPRLDRITLKKRVYREIEQAPKKEYQSLLKTLLPRLLIPYAVNITKIDKHVKNHLLSKEQIEELIDFLKKFSFQINKTAPLKTAIVTKGGINIKDVDSKSMESKIVANLFFAGEIIGLVGPTGGFNLQKAFSTGWVAGKFSS